MLRMIVLYLEACQITDMLKCAADEELGDHFQGREGWRQVVDEGRAAGWLLRMQDVSHISHISHS